jgi:hypothetical protein
MNIKAKEDALMDNKPMLRKVLTSKVKQHSSGSRGTPLNHRAKTSKEPTLMLNPDYEPDQEVYLEDKEIQNHVRNMINEAKRLNRRGTSKLDL